MPRGKRYLVLGEGGFLLDDSPYPQSWDPCEIESFTRREAEALVRRMVGQLEMIEMPDSPRDMYDLVVSASHAIAGAENPVVQVDGWEVERAGPSVVHAYSPSGEQCHLLVMNDGRVVYDRAFRVPPEVRQAAAMVVEA